MKVVKSLGLVGRLLAGLLVGAIGSIVVAPPAYALYAYNRQAAVEYAKKYSCNAGNCQNSAFIYFLTGDCTNFVSQAMNIGGEIPIIKIGSPSRDWYYETLPNLYPGLNIYTGPGSWVRVSALYSQLQATGRISSLSYPSMAAKNSGALSGDLYMYDWGQGEGFSHLSISTEYGNFTNFTDPEIKRNYRSITGGVGSKMAQHTKDRDGAPWNWGYHTEVDPVVKARMKTVVIHLSSISY